MCDMCANPFNALLSVVPRGLGCAAAEAGVENERLLQRRTAATPKIKMQQSISSRSLRKPVPFPKTFETGSRFGVGGTRNSRFLDTPSARNAPADGSE
jgi:hypothetical protein